ncbi:MAG TPA: FkbM family methyltransferase [Pseudolabrys sp.]|jgi:FkbM family methyltransferase|nr:FkbM family methyltransferase [Pseudolabrys sp.]
MPWNESWRLKLRRRVRKPYNALFHRDYFIAGYLGAKFLLAPHGIGTLEMSAGISERPELEHFMHRCRELEPECIIDIGANIGMYSCIALKNRCVPRAILFEPDIRNRAQLAANLLMNDLIATTEVHPIALGNVEGSFHLLPGAVDGGFSRIATAAEPGSYEVPVRRLDDMISISGRRLAIKIDVEGFEHQVIDGMRSTLCNNECLVQIESFKSEPLIRELQSLGYRLTNDFMPNFVFENRSK